MIDLQNQENQQLFQAVDNDIAANCSGGVAILYNFVNSEPSGGFRILYRSTPNLNTLGFDNVTSSIRINQGQRWRFYTGPNYTDSSITLGPGTHRLGDFASLFNGRRQFNNRISSARRIS